MHIDLVLEGAELWRGTKGIVSAGSLAISGDHIVCVGTRDRVRAFVQQYGEGFTPRIRTYQEGFIIPGFHDSHIHFFHSALFSSSLAASFIGTSEADCVQKMKKQAQRQSSGWLLSQGWREYRWKPACLPSKESLDQAFPNRPVALYSGDAHTLWLNSVALRILGINRQSAAPKGGSYERNSHGDLTGIVREAAAMELMPKIVGSFSEPEVKNIYRSFLQTLAQNGITSVCDMSLMAHSGLDFIRDDIYEALLKQDQMTARVTLFPTLLDNFKRFDDLTARFSSSLMSVGGCKQFFDGVSSQHTAWLSRPYSKSHYVNDWGKPTIDPKHMQDLVFQAAARGIAVRIHTIGDEAIHQALNIFEAAHKRFGNLPAKAHNCLEHVELPQSRDIKRFAQLGVVAAVQPAHMTLDPGGPENDLGQERAANMWPLQSLLKSDAILALGTDSPVVPVKPFDGLYAAITRQDPRTHLPRGGWNTSERLSMQEAMHAYTKGSACAAGKSSEEGSLEKGQLADVTVVDRNLFTCSPEEVQRTNVLATYMGGRCVYDA